MSHEPELRARHDARQFAATGAGDCNAEYVKAENAVAVFNNGVLEIEMPAIPIPEVRKRTVEITG